MCMFPARRGSMTRIQQQWIFIGSLFRYMLLPLFVILSWLPSSQGHCTAVGICSMRDACLSCRMPEVIAPQIIQGLTSISECYLQQCWWHCGKTKCICLHFPPLSPVTVLNISVTSLITQREHQTLPEIRCLNCACHQDGLVISSRLPYPLSNTISHAEKL